MIKILFNVFYADKNILFFNEGSCYVIFSCNGMAILNIDINNVNLDDTNYDEDDPDTTILVKRLAWHMKFEKHKALKKKRSEELMPIVCHPKIWWNFWILQDEGKEIEPIFTK